MTFIQLVVGTGVSSMQSQRKAEEEKKIRFHKQREKKNRKIPRAVRNTVYRLTEMTFKAVSLDRWPLLPIKVSQF